MNTTFGDKLLIIFLFFGVGYSCYMLFGNKSFIYPYFWRTLHHILIWGALLTISILGLFEFGFGGGILRTFGWGTIVALILALFIFMICLANTPKEKYRELLESNLWSTLFAIVEPIMLTITVFISKLWDKILKIFQ